ncbi:hypothetical protein [Schleiferilactobacillus shenzhenensis]|uniref:Uncharacterized protein n=1 Tax=Schleiferilactobacillus shenzhenensis LY-73 TaxID=1231336 RepID=U4TJE8_9LACO|nr:hypothetical protein [Schleiferilactobacillus shenzhenensis]ERL64946.1 hypothetical protein L248_3108 [Schleiferilactobacillus shenzhenensis LY-73]
MRYGRLLIPLYGGAFISWTAWTALVTVTARWVYRFSLIDFLGYPSMMSVGSWLLFVLICFWLSRTMGQERLQPLFVQIRWGSRRRVFWQYSVTAAWLIVCLLIPLSAVHMPLLGCVNFAMMIPVSVFHLGQTTTPLTLTMLLVVAFWPLLWGLFLLGWPAFLGRVAIVGGWIAVQWILFTL